MGRIWLSKHTSLEPPGTGVVEPGAGCGISCLQAFITVRAIIKTVSMQEVFFILNLF
jgi:hypothetical protein